MVRGRSAAICAAIGALALTGCGSSNAGRPSATSGNAIARAAYVSGNTSGYKLAMTLKESLPSLGGAITGTGSGAFDLAHHTGSLTLNFALPASVATLGKLTLHEVITAQTLYLELPAVFASRLPGGKPWLEVNLAQAAKASGIQGISSLTGGPASANPAQFLQYLRATSAAGLRNLGSATVDGIQTTHYRSSISLSKVPDAMPAADRAAAKQTISSLESLTGLHQLPVDVWVDSQNLVRQLKLAYTATVSGQSVTSVIQLDFTSYGPQPSPAIPPAGQVSNLLSVLGKSGSTL